MSGYLELAKRVVGQAPATEEEVARHQERKREEAERRGLAIRWSDYPTWIALHDPLSGEWVEVKAADCFPSLVEEANRRRSRGEAATEKRKIRRKETWHE